MRTAIQEYIEKHDKKLEEDANYAVDYFQSLIIDASSDIDEVKSCIERMRKNKDLPPYIQHRLDMISLELNASENNMDQVLKIIKKAEEDENKNKNKEINNNDNNQEQHIRNELVVNPCDSDHSEGCVQQTGSGS